MHGIGIVDGSVQSGEIARPESGNRHAVGFGCLPDRVGSFKSKKEK
jgi:hypothetical protein